MRWMKTRGIAIITVLLAMTVLLMITAAFLRVNRDNFNQLNSTEKRDKAHAACAAVYDYLLYCLEHDKTYAVADFIGGSDSELTSPEMRVQMLPGTKTIEGEIRSLDATFQATISNNLNVDAESAAGVPPHSALITIQAESNGVKRNIETLIRVAPLFDSSALSRGAINVEANNLNVRSRDKYRNMIRAEGEIHVPTVLSGTPLTRFLEPETTKFDSKGMIWAKDKIFAGGDDLTDDIAEANTNSGGRFVPNAKQHFEIHNLQATDIQVPTSSIPVKPGEYRFTMATATITATSAHHYQAGKWPFKYRQDDKTQWTTTQLIHVMEYYENPTDPAPKKVYRSDTRLDDLVAPPVKGTVDSTVIDSVDIVYDTPGANGATIPVDVNDVVYIDDDGGTKVAVDLKNQRVNLPKGETVTAAGDFMITTERGDPPIIDLGSTKSDRAAIVAQGSVNLQAGVTQGYGTLVAANGDLMLRPEGNQSIDISANGFDGLVAYAGRDVLLENPSDSGSWTFNGLVYASRNFDFDAKNADARLEGSLVARTGDINFRQAGDVDFVYNPEFLDAMLKALPENRIQIERVYWKE
jgi:hypothetical protein